MRKYSLVMTLAIVIYMLCAIVVQADNISGDSRPAGSTPLFKSYVIRRVETHRPMVAITVDDFFTANYSWQTAIQILEAANEAHATLTLCPAGSALDTYSRLHPEQAAEIKRLFNDGSYELCNHTYSHPVMPRLGAKGGEYSEIGEISRGQQAIFRFFGREPSMIFRPPFGSWNPLTERAAFDAGYQRTVTWSIDTGDSEGPERAAAQLVADTACVAQGDIVLMHANRRSSAQALPLIIALVRSKGLEPVSLSTLLASGTPVDSYNPSDMKRLATCRSTQAHAIVQSPAQGARRAGRRR